MKLKTMEDSFEQKVYIKQSPWSGHQLAGWWPMDNDIFKHNVSVMLELTGHFVKTLMKNSDQW